MFLLQLELHCSRSDEKLVQLDLVIPGLCGPLPEINSLNSEAIHALISWLAKASRKATYENNFYQVLARLFAINATDSFPAAALSLLASGQYSEQGHWFCVDPVHLQADMDHALLRGAQGLDLTQQESEAFIAELNQHFQQDGIRFVMTGRHSWFINVPDHANVETTPVNDVVGRNIYAFMPQGDDALFWKRVLNEVQMLLHQSPVNAQRAANHKLAINGVWLWGGGALPEAGKLPYAQIYAQHAIVCGLAALNKTDCNPVAASGDFIENASGNSRAIVVVDDLYNVTSHGDVNAWQSVLNDLYVGQLKTLLNVTMKKNILVNLYPCNGVCYQLRARDKFKIFRDRKIESHINTYE